jgi:5-methylcytosine-specific restriction endonuclease McrA
MAAYGRKSTVPIQDVLPFVIFGPKQRKKACYKVYDGTRINMSSLRYQLFSQKGTICVSCGIEGKFFAIERPYSAEKPSGWHFNLYALNSQGHEVLMTKDHIVPRSKGGPDTLENFQTMCTKCNHKKGNQEEK